jgi:hypothetical protein
VSEATPAIHSRASALIFRAGKKAREHIRQYGLRAGDIGLLPGAAGGPKGIGLLGLDRAIFGQFLPQAIRQRTLIGASVGSWRFAAVAAGGDDPQQIVTNLDRLAHLYTGQRFPKGISAAEVSRRCEAMLDSLLAGCDQTILHNTSYRLVILADRCRHLFASDQPLLLMLALASVVATNLVSRSALRWFIERTLFFTDDEFGTDEFSTRDDVLPLMLPDAFSTKGVALTPDNLRDALMASASIPLVLQGVKNITGAARGTYRDGGLLDYHLDLPYATDGLVLYPHFSHRVTPGWFDKPLKWRSGDPENLSSVLLVAPSADYLSRLPHGKLPSRDDFRRYRGDDGGREKYWQHAIAESERLGDEFLEQTENGKIAERLIDF